MEDKADWLPKKSDYREGKKQFAREQEFQSNILHGRDAIKILRTKVLPTLNHPLSFLLVGVGLEGPVFKCPYEPYNIAAFLEHSGVQYGATLLDKDPITLDDIKKRTRVILPLSDYSTNHDYQSAWKDYLTWVGEPEQVAHVLDDNIQPVAEKARSLVRKVDDELAKGVLTAPVPDELIRKIQQGEIQLVSGDIATSDQLPFGPFDFIACTNVFYQMTEIGQKLALANIADQLTSSGILLIDDRRSYPIPSMFNAKNQEYTGTSSILPKYGGWLTDDKLKQLKLVVDQELEENQQFGVTTFALRKI